jgi:homoserine O-succinyltransferase/O-acetyltransferase
MPLLLDTVQAGSTGDLDSHNCLTIGLVNNMPDSACHATERQFLDLLRVASHNVVIRVRLFAIPDVPRAEEMRRELAGRYRDIAELWNAPVDGLIVTGTEPRAVRLQSEPYWLSLSQLVDWARGNTTSTVWSCLAAHAAVLHADGVTRQPLAKKLSGVFDGETVARHQLLAGIEPRLRMPHSRLNDLPELSLRTCGYLLLSSSAAAGVDAFVKEEDHSSLFVFFQGHPEYEADSLLREYRRDVGRFLRRERDIYPEMPQNYFNDAATFLADDFRVRAIGERRGDLVGDFPMGPLVDGIENSWRNAAIGIYRNWINYLKERKRYRKGLPMIRRPRRVSA